MTNSKKIEYHDKSKFSCFKFTSSINMQFTQNKFENNQRINKKTKNNGLKLRKSCWWIEKLCSWIPV